ncbi:RNA ligase family protein [Aquincola tertiaricarbonis]|uniref:RNA ligase family protein n=1 Tax=Aquincola tertiaricarbonis TaxID=391953 RepID=UPI000614D519|nr:RNA ligase family protein [Aquincola tertiaricarbonis]
MTGDFFRFPHTPHLAWLGPAESRADKVLSSSEAASLTAHTLTVEEKLDGANLGFSLGPEGELRVQNRGTYLSEPHVGQFTRLSAWLAAHGEGIAEALLDHHDSPLILFGEWCAARHSLAYTRLPDWLLLFDVFDSGAGRFWSSTRRNAMAERLGLVTTPRVAQGHFHINDLIKGLDIWPSRFRDGPLEGVVVRKESADWCEQRAKLVRADFTQAIGEHWRGRQVEWNRLATPSGH